MWSHLSPPGTAGLGTAGSLARLGELERQLVLAALADASSHAIRRQHRPSWCDHTVPFSAGGVCRDEGKATNKDRTHGGGIRASSSESDLHGRLNPRLDTNTVNLRTRSESLDTAADSLGDSPILQQRWGQQHQHQQPRALPLTAPALPGSQSRAHQRRLEGLHTSLRGLLAVYDCAAPQLMDLANEISDEAEIWDALLYR